MNASSTPSTLRLEATHLALREIGGWLDQVFDTHGWRGSPSRGAVELAVHELATNSVDHADSSKGELVVQAAGADLQLTVTVVDQGQEFVASEVSAPKPGEPQVGGYGLMIIEAVASALSYERTGTTNTWRASFTIEPPG